MNALRLHALALFLLFGVIWCDSLLLEHNVGSGGAFVPLGDLSYRKRWADGPMFAHVDLPSSPSFTPSASLYTIRTRASPDAPFVFSSLPVSDELRSRYASLQIFVQLATDGGVLAVWARIPDEKQALPQGKNAVLYPMTSVAPLSDASASRAKSGRSEAEKKEKPEEKSFLGKYWMYIALGLGFILVQGLMAPQGGAGAAAAPAAQ